MELLILILILILNAMLSYGVCYPGCYALCYGFVILRLPVHPGQQWLEAPRRDRPVPPSPVPAPLPRSEALQL